MDPTLHLATGIALVTALTATGVLIFNAITAALDEIAYRRIVRRRLYRMAHER